MDIATTALSGLDQAQSRLEQIVTRLARLADPNDTVDLSAEMVAMMQSQTDFSANAQVVKTAGEMQKHILEVLA